MFLTDAAKNTGLAIGRILSYVQFFIPKISPYTLLIAAFIASMIGIIVYFATKPTSSDIALSQLQLFNGTISSLTQERASIKDYLETKELQSFKENAVLVNYAPLTVVNAGYLGPADGGSFDPQALRLSLDLGFRCFIFSIDFYTGSQKDSKLFGKSREPCLLYRDQNDVLRSANSGDLKLMFNALAQQAFAPGLATGKDPLILILDFKNTPDRIQNQQEYIDFLGLVSVALAPFKSTLLTTLNTVPFTALQNPGLLLVQPIEDLQGKTLIFTNANTDVFTDPLVTSELKAEKNLRNYIHGTFYSSSGDDIPKDGVTSIAPKGTQLTEGRQRVSYWLSTPSKNLADAQAKTNNALTLSDYDTPYANIANKDRDALLNTYGVQIIPFTIFDTPASLTEFMKTWGSYSWKMKSASLQYQVVKAVPPQVISKKADANQGNPKVPSLNL